MPERLRAYIHQAFMGRHACACLHSGTFFVQEMVAGEASNVAVEMFLLKGHPEATMAFAVGLDDKEKRRYFAALRLPPIDSPFEALQDVLAVMRDPLITMRHFVLEFGPWDH